MSTLRDLRRRVVAGLIFIPFLPFYLVSIIVLRLVARKRSIHGLTVYDISRSDNNAHLEALTAGLQIMREYAPWHYRHAVRDLRRVWVEMRKDDLPRFDSVNRSLALGSSFLLEQSSYAIATMLVFVTTSARLYRRFGVARPGNAMRRQRICLEAALSFARRLPESEQIVRLYTRAWDSGFWNPDAIRFRRNQELHDRGMPRPALTFLEWLQR